MTAVVAIMGIFRRKRCKLRSSIFRNEKHSCRKAERANFPEENTHGSKSSSQKLRKGQIPKKLASKSKKLELKCTGMKLNSKKTCSDCAKIHDPSISSGLREKQNIHILNNLSAMTSPIKVKNKTIRVLVDSGSSGDLLFTKKGSSKHISVVKWVIPQSWGTSNGTFVTVRVGDIEISFVEYLASKKVHLQLDIVEYNPETKRQFMTS